MILANPRRGSVRIGLFIPQEHGVAMSPNIQTELRIPALWFDFYARLLPGTAFIAAVRVFVAGNAAMPSFSEMLFLAFAGYFSGMLSQPLGSRLTRAIERIVGKCKFHDATFVWSLERKLGSDSQEAPILAKMHGEVTFFAQLFVLAGFFFLVQLVQALTGDTCWSRPFVTFPVALYFLGGACEVALRRAERAAEVTKDVGSVGRRTESASEAGPPQSPS